jgi:hypothetical protein
VVFTLVDRRARAEGGDAQLSMRLVAEVRARGWPRCEAMLSRSPRVEALNSGTGKPRSILHHARGTVVHGEMQALCLELLRDLAPALARAPASASPDELWGAPRSAAAEPLRRVARHWWQGPWPRREARPPARSGALPGADRTR